MHRLRHSSPTSTRAEIRPGVWLDSRLALWIEPLRTLAIADLHWGYAASHRARGNLLPWWGDDEIEQRLRGLLTDYQPAEMLWLGDVVHAAEGAARVERFLAETKIPVAILAGNHDRRWRAARERTLRRGDFFFHHGDTEPAIPTGCIEVIGHHHPAISWGDGAGGRARLPALVASERRLVLPAFSPWAAGTPWNLRREPGEVLWGIAPNRIFSLPSAAHFPPVNTP
jgi:metallophosphoesterase superfamily enzyme